MNRSVALLTAALLIAAGPALAQDKAKGPQRVQNTLLENDKVRVYESVSKPGEVSGNVVRPYRLVRVPYRIVRALQGGTLQRTYPDGKTEKREWKTGEVRAEGPDKKFSGKNVGKTEIVLYGVEPKQAKK